MENTTHQETPKRTEKTSFIRNLAKKITAQQATQLKYGFIIISFLLIELTILQFFFIPRILTYVIGGLSTINGLLNYLVNFTDPELSESGFYYFYKISGGLLLTLAAIAAIAALSTGLNIFSASYFIGVALFCSAGAGYDVSPHHQLYLLSKNNPPEQNNNVSAYDRRESRFLDKHSGRNADRSKEQDFSAGNLPRSQSRPLF